MSERGDWRCASCGAARDEHVWGERDGLITHAYEPSWVAENEDGLIP